MRLSTVLLTAGAAAILLSACSSASQGSTAALLPPSAGGSHVGVINPHLPNRGKASLILRKLYVTDNNNNDVAVFKYGKWTSVGTITSGIVSPYADWVDRSGNLYVTNNQTNPTNIVEYDSSGNQIFTYSAGIREPAGVTTDKYGNVYEADQFGMVDEYAQGSNVATATCSLPYGDQATAVAVNRRGGVFVSFYSFSSETGGIVAYPRGLHNNPYPCLNSVLPVKLFEPTGMAFDTQGNLLVCDANYYVHAVDVIAPPFNSVTGTLGSGWSFPTSVTIDRAGTQVYVTDAGAGDVSVFTYPGGANVATLGSADGLSLPVAAVDSKNYVP
jgi:DNA-binding beta-propeller fold protein YncE